MTLTMTSSTRLAFAAAVVAVLLAGRVSDATAPTGQYTLGTGVTAGTAYDTKSRLTWQRVTVANATVEWQDAVAYCAALDLNGTGWRLPTQKELFSLVDRTRAAAPFIDPTAFPGGGGPFWSSTPVAGSPANVWWYVDFDRGIATSGGPDPESANFSTRCVR
jgi:Protein of unknown function (DUF1566)